MLFTLNLFLLTFSTQISSFFLMKKIVKHYVAYKYKKVGFQTLGRIIFFS